MEPSSPAHQLEKSSESVISPLFAFPPPNKKSRNYELDLPSDSNGDESIESVETDTVSQELVTSPLDSQEQSSNVGLESLPWPAHKRIFYDLHNDGDNKDLNNLAKVSPRFLRGVKEYMSREGNRPGLKEVLLWKMDGGLEVDMNLYRSNLSFHNLDKLDWARFKLHKYTWCLSVTLTGPDDPIIDQVVDLLSTYLRRVYIGGMDPLSSADLSLTERLLRSSTIKSLDIRLNVTIDDSIASLISSIVSGVSQDLDILTEQSQLSDPASFIAQLYASSVSTVHLGCFSPFYFFGLPNSYWVNFLNEKLSTGSFEYIDMNDGRGRITTAQTNLPNARMNFLEWKKATK